VIDYESLAQDYARHRRLHPGVLRSLLEGGGVTGASRVLEVGCGTGNYVGALRRLTGCAAVGLDPAAAMLGEARGAAAATGLCRGRAEALPFADASFDLVFSVDVIHHVGDRAAFHREAARLLRPGARLCTATDSEEIIRGRVPLSRYFPETVAVELARYPRIETLLDLMGAAGLNDLRTETVEATYAVTSSAPYSSCAYSSLLLIGDEALRAGVARLDADLARGPVAGVARYVLLWGTQ
jgi:ubiquinone/menaquinone biosynthesis C-methylase UbiE